MRGNRMPECPSYRKGRHEALSSYADELPLTAAHSCSYNDNVVQYVLLMASRQAPH